LPPAGQRYALIRHFRFGKLDIFTESLWFPPSKMKWLDVSSIRKPTWLPDRESELFAAPAL
jgi:hypothetical protein